MNKKKPFFYGWATLLLILFVVALIALGMFIAYTADVRNLYSAQTPLQKHIANHVRDYRGLGIVAVIVLFIWGIASTFKAQRKSERWDWDNRRDTLSYAKLVKVGDHKPTYADMTTSLEVRRDFKLKLKYGDGYEKIVRLPSDVPGMREVLHRPENEYLWIDKHITKTQIIAVNSTAITTTEQRVSIGKALIGGLLAGEAGFVLGGLSGRSYSTTNPGENAFTFLVFYDNKSPSTEKVKENTERFKFLISKMET